MSRLCEFYECLPRERKSERHIIQVIDRAVRKGRGVVGLRSNTCKETSHLSIFGKWETCFRQSIRAIKLPQALSPSSCSCGKVKNSQPKKAEPSKRKKPRWYN